MTHTTPNRRCAKCKAVFSPHWTHCRICKTPLHTSSPPPANQICRLHPGDLIAYKTGDTLQQGEIRQVTLTGSHLTCQLTSGQTVPGHAIRAVGTRDADHTLATAFSTRNEENLMSNDLPSQAEPPSPRSQDNPPRSPWYCHWKDIADMTAPILPHEPRMKLITTMLDRCDIAYHNDDEKGFLRLKEQLRNLINASTPKSIKTMP